MNTVTFVGNLTRDPELRFTPAGRPVATVPIAVHHRFQVNGETVERTLFIDTICWGQLAENTAASLHKGDRVMVVGRIEQREYETASGEQRTSIELIADDIAVSVRFNPVLVEKQPGKVERSSGQSRKQRREVSSDVDDVPAMHDPIYGDEEAF